MGWNKENLLGQGYDGATVMSCKCSGIQVRIMEMTKYAFYVRHCQNLAIVVCMKNLPEAEAVYLFFLA